MEDAKWSQRCVDVSMRIIQQWVRKTKWPPFVATYKHMQSTIKYFLLGRQAPSTRLAMIQCSWSTEVQGLGTGTLTVLGFELATFLICSRLCLLSILCKIAICKLKKTEKASGCLNKHCTGIILKKKQKNKQLISLVHHMHVLPICFVTVYSQSCRIIYSKADFNMHPHLEV